MSEWKPFSLPHLDQAEPHVLVRREPVEHEDGRFVPRPAPEGVTELIVFMLDVADLHAQGPPPVPGRKHTGHAKSARSRDVALGGGGGTHRSSLQAHFQARPTLLLPLLLHIARVPRASPSRSTKRKSSRKYLKCILWNVCHHIITLNQEGEEGYFLKKHDRKQPPVNTYFQQRSGSAKEASAVGSPWVSD